MIRPAPLLPPLLLAAALSGCALGPRYSQPTPPPAAEAGFITPAPISQAPAVETWWQLYNDPVLDALIEQAFAANTDLRVATANLARVRAVLLENKGARLPNTTITGSAVNTQRVILLPSGPAAFRTDFFSLGLDASYEIDLYARVGSAIAAALADAEAERAALDTVRITVAAETARAYADACSAARQRAVAEQNLSLQSQSFALTERRVAAGRDAPRDAARARGPPEKPPTPHPPHPHCCAHPGGRVAAGRDAPLDAARARAQQENTRATLPAFTANRQSALARLAFLTGRPPAEVDPRAAACVAPPQLTTEIPVGDGAALLKRRPDIRQAERELAAATARISVAIADLFPQVSLGGNISGQGVTPGTALSSDGFGFSIGPAISWTFPNIAVARARIRQSRASADAALATYDGTILRALQETETALADYAAGLNQRAALLVARDQSAEAARLVRLRYAAGAENFLAVLDAERTLASAEAQLAASEAALTTTQIALFKALGGGWAVPEE